MLMNWQQALTVLLVIVPGFVWQGVRRSILGPMPAERELSVRVLRAVAVSGALALVYIVILGESLTRVLRAPEAPRCNVRADAAWAFCLVFLIPTVLGFVEAFWKQKKVHPELAWKERLGSYDPTPTAWDFGFRTTTADDFVRVLTKSGDWCGGRVGTTGFFTGYPEGREIFLETAYVIDPSGQFGEPVTGSQGVWIDCSDAQLVQRVSNTGPAGNGHNGSDSTGEGAN